MNKWEKEVQQSLLDSEEAAIKALEAQYKAALKSITDKVKLFQADIDMLDQALEQEGLDDAARALLQSRKRAKIYQQQYQKALQSQVNSILDKMQGDNYATIDKYLKGCYETGYIGTMYDIAKQGVPIIAPINQAAVVKAVLTDSKIKEGFYNALGVSVKHLKKTITQEVSRGIASSLPYSDIARNIANVARTGLSNAKRITRTEGHRIQQTSTRDAQEAAKAKGADVVKQWDAALDSRTRDSHRRVDGEIRELEERFSNGLMFPGDPTGGAAEVINCRCTSNTRARWALDEDELKTLQERAAYFGLDKSKNFEEYKGKYLKGATQVQAEEIKAERTIAEINESATDSLLDAYDERRKRFNLNESTAEQLRELPLNPFTVDYSGLSVETAEEFNDVITRLSQQYYTGLTKIEVGNPRNFIGSSVFANTSHQTAVGQMTMTINPLKTKDYEKLMERINELQRKGYAVKLIDGASGQYIATHEFAHSLFDMESPLKNYIGMDVRMMKNVRAEVNDLYDEYKAEVAVLEKAAKDAEMRFIMATEADDVARLRAEYQAAKSSLDAIKISGYSLQNADEFLAEAFTQFHIGASRSQYTDDLMVVVNKYFGKSMDNHGDTALSNIVQAGRIEANGRFVNNSEKLYRYAANVKPLKGYEDFTCHADSDTFYIDMKGEGKEEDFIELTVKEFAEAIRNSNSYKGGDVRIISCQSGAKADGAAQQLANELQKAVYAPTEIVNIDENGNMFISDNDILAEMWYHASEEERAKIKETGKWIRFEPEKG